MSKLERVCYSFSSERKVIKDPVPGVKTIDNTSLKNPNVLTLRLSSPVDFEKLCDSVQSSSKKLVLACDSRKIAIYDRQKGVGGYSPGNEVMEIKKRDEEIPVVTLFNRSYSILLRHYLTRKNGKRN